MPPKGDIFLLRWKEKKNISPDSTICCVRYYPRPQRTQLFTLPERLDEHELIRHYTLSPDDLAFILLQREDHNRLGFAVQLGYLRVLGRPMVSGETIPYALLTYLAAQLHLSPQVFAGYAKRDATRREHAAKIQKYLRLRSLTVRDEHILRHLLRAHALQTGSNIAVATALLEEMRSRKIIIPSVSTVERVAYTIQEEARHILFAELTTHLATAQKARLDALLTLRDKTQTHLVWLKNFPRRPTPQGVLSILDRIDYIDRLHLPPRGSNSSDNRVTRLAREGLRHTPQYIERLEAKRRHGLLVAMVAELRRDLIDQAILMHDKMMGQFFNRSEWQQKEAFHKRGKAINEKVRLYAKIGKALIRAKESNTNWKEAIASVISWEKYRASVAEAETLIMGENFDFLDHLKSRYSYLRQYVPQLLGKLPIEATAGGQALLAALCLLKELNATGKRALPAEAPTAFITARWAPYIFTGRKLDRQYYELHALAELRNQFRSGDVYVTGSRTHQEFETYVLPPADWERRKRSGQTGLAIPTDWPTYITGRSALLHERLSAVNKQIARGRLPEVSLTNGVLHIGQLEKSVPEAALSLTQRAYSLVPPVKLTDLLVEVDSWTHFSDYFTRDDEATTGVKEKAVLFAAILADAINLGLRQMAHVSPGISLNQLAWMSDYYLREETYQKALSEIINFHHHFPFSGYWGEGKTASADGQHFPIYSRKGHTAHTNAKYGNAPSAMFYTHISDQYSPFYTQPITATARDATYVLDGLLYHQTDLVIEEMYTDTAGFTDHVFALCHLLGIRFAPRIRDLPDKKLSTIEPPATYKALVPLIGNRSDVRGLEKNWEAMLRLACSIKSGTATASLPIRKLAAQRSSLSTSLRELGRIERTLFMLDYVEQPKLRLQILMGLNKGEVRNALAKAVFFYRRGELMDRTWEEQYNSASGLNLVVAAIILWNTVYLAKAIAHLKHQGEVIPEEYLKHLSPVAWEHISLTGEYLWDLRQGTTLDALRSLRAA